MSDGPASNIRVGRAGFGEASAWAVALNKTASTDQISVTLLALAVAGDVVSISGVLRLLHRHDVLLATVPILTLTTSDDHELGSFGAHALPSGEMIWVSWTYRRPREVRSRYVALIDKMDLAYRAGGGLREAVIGPWAFKFAIPLGSGLVAH
jgi:hypothetical protein